MKIKELLKICEEAPCQDAEVYIPTDCSQSATTNIGYNFDDNNDLDLYEVSK
jgi:hypothetical protein